MTPEQEKHVAMEVLVWHMKRTPTLGDVRKMLAIGGHSNAESDAVEAIQEYVNGHLERLATYFESRL